MPATNGGPIKVLIVDDSAVVRAMISRELAKEPGIEVIPPAPDPYVARERIKQYQPHVLVLDVEMPKMDGITFLKLLMEHHPIPTIIVSSITQSGSQTAMAALDAGAFEVIGKPSGSSSVIDVGRQLTHLIRAAANVKLAPRKPGAPRPAMPARATSTPQMPMPTMSGSGPFIAIGASTGGVQAITAVLRHFPANAPATVFVQHMPAGFTAGLASRLNEMCAVRIKEAQHGDLILPHQVLIAPGGYHLRVKPAGINFVVELITTPPVHHQRPAVDITFESVAKHWGRKCVAAVLTGMGADGAEGLLAIKKAGGRTIAQDEKSCTVFGMPQQCIKLGAADEVLPLDKIAGSLLKKAQRRAA